MAGKGVIPEVVDDFRFGINFFKKGRADMDEDRKIRNMKKELERVCETDSTQREAKEIIDGKGLGEFATRAARHLDRRAFLATMGGAAASLSLLNLFTGEAHAAGKDYLPPQKYNAVYCSLGMSIFWVTDGADTLKNLGEILGFKFKIYDGKLNVDNQRQQIETVASQAKDWDAVFIHPNAIGAFTEPCKKIIAAGTPLIDIDTRLTEKLEDLDIVTFTEPDNEFMGAAVTEELCSAINFEGGIVETQGMLTHTGAQGRHRGFMKTVKKYPKIKILDQTPANWDQNKVREIWDNLLVKYGKEIKAGFFHNDDMALAAQAACQSNGYEAGAKGIYLGGVDATAPALKEFKKGRLYATVSNPSGRDHGFGLWAAYYHIVRGEDVKKIPKHLICDGPLYSRSDALIWEKVESGMWLSDHYLI
jgi:ribose transport system substrate-binding protein